jgi:hypothetical protein
MPAHFKSLHGFALISVLIFLEIFSMLTFFSIRASGWEIRMTNQRLMKQKLTYAAATILNHVETGLDQSLENCLLPPLPSTELIQKPLSWWQSHSCTGNFDRFQYYYVIELSGVDNCALISSGQIAAYYRITVLVMFMDNTDLQSLWQSSFVLPTVRRAECQPSHLINAGRQLARVLI